MTEDRSDWVHKHKEGGKMAAAASLGMLLMWDVDEGLNQVRMRV
jgi:26S proteasome regulatory subunit N1